MTFDDISTFYAAHQALVAGIGALAGVAVLLLASHRLRAMKQHRATLLVANILTIIAAALATMVSASGMWKLFTDILGHTPLRIAFFAFIEIALFASALLARSRLLRDPHNETTGIDGIAVWVLATLTATLSALDSDSLREVCLRLVAPLIAAWMWERALAAERHVRLGKPRRRINWAVTPQRIFVWLRLADAGDRDVSQVDLARRRARLGRARLHLHLLQSRNAFAWRVRHAHRRVIRQAMQAAEHIGLADFPHATNEREAIQMYMATLYGFVDATSPQAVAHLNAWRATPAPRHNDASPRATDATSPTAAGNGPGTTKDNLTAQTTNRVNATNALTPPLTGHTTRVDASRAAAHSLPATQANGRRVITDAALPQFITPEADTHSERMDQPIDHHQSLDLNTRRQRPSHGGLSPQAAGLGAAARDGTGAGGRDDEPVSDDQPGDEADLTAVAAMRRFWDRQVANGQAPTGAELSRAAGVPPTTGLGRRKRREWDAQLPQHLKPPTDNTR